MKEKILKVLYESKGQYKSGEELAELFGVSRTAIWKQINSLKKEGHIIETVNKKGYQLMENDNLLVPVELQSMLDTEEIGHHIIYFDSIKSTNTYAKEIAHETPHGVVIIGNEQTEGRGRMGRGWTSPKGKGIFMSIILKPQIPPTEGAKMTQIAAAATCLGIRSITSLDVLIKWPNDVIINGKKVCGILTEMSGELNQVAYIIVGIGINVNTEEFPEDLREKGTSLLIEGKKHYSRKEMIVAILNEFEKLYQDYIKSGSLQSTIEICKKYSAMLGKEIRIIQGNKETIAKAVDITEEGLLKIAQEGGKEDLVFSGEVSVRGKDGYI
ncbi:biotin--[acetyl-CoA-carboxylase] ligase [Alkaliphilus hydrothermalis]|uniref:Bifunctional ligase/repressor BirA n=1 Tax=Alkaliphilus hydrothermalis TaxID=1482730 RepID=A0ABS2NT18_9FIRM|nr:biotin--[acetyl-CoA-carboxylase] ligase [Alkaliphilus hydrothermalis]MBM7615981.1 BirA family biotin operon repressor/biotin-[acetyl-CoA-carboxylase] ligase [Alkaliphilus hydrothermalis]